MGGEQGGDRELGSQREGEADQSAHPGYLRRLARPFAMRGTSGNLFL